MRRLLLSLWAAVAVCAAGPATALAYDADDLERRLGAEMRLAGSSSGALVRHLDTGDTLYARRADSPRVPASVEKLFTTSTALLRYGPAGTLTTRVAMDGLVIGGVLRGDLYLIGGGDPTLGAAALRVLAEQVRERGITRIEGRVYGDESLFDSRRGGPNSGYRYSPYMGGVLSALTYRRGFHDRLSPPADAADRFAAWLRLRDVDAPAGGLARQVPREAVEIARLNSPTMEYLSAYINGPSDNFASEMVLKALGAGYGRGGTTPAGAQVVETTMRELGVAPVAVDGSGLSRDNRTTPRQVVRLIQVMAKRPEGTAFRTSLPVTGRSGTVARRMRGTPAQRRCRVKTGTLIGVSSLAGVCQTRAADEVAFAFLLNGVNTSAAKRLEDRMTAAIARVDESLD